MATYSMLSVQMALFLALSCTSITHKAAYSFTFNRGISSLATTRVAAKKTARYAVTKEAVEIWRQKAGFGTVKVQDNSSNDTTTSNNSNKDTTSSNNEASTTLITAATAAADIANEEHQTEVAQAVQTDDDNSNNNSSEEEEEEERYMPPWSLATQRAPSSKAFARFRQHVNPLSRRFQMPTDLPENWPYSDFTNVNLPLYLDIGCGKGGFLLELVGRRHGNVYADGTDTYMNNTRLFTDTTDEWLPSTMNYLGLEIRPGVSQYAQNRVEKRGLSGKLSFVGCNANVDLDRLLSLYTESAETEVVDDGAIGDGESNNELKFVSIQFPDPHFKKSHTKRRVVTPALVTTLAKFMNQGGVVFLQSDIKEALEAMREKFVEDDGLVYFDEHCDDDDCKIDVGSEEEYGLANPLGIPTEREVSVLNQDLPIYRTLFLRNDVSYPSKSSDLARNL